MANLTVPHVDTYASVDEWSLSQASQSLTFSLIFPFTSLLIMSFPYRFDRWLAVTMVLASGYAAFVTSDDLSPDDKLNEIYKRYVLIGGSYMLSMAYKLNGKNTEQTLVGDEFVPQSGTD